MSSEPKTSSATGGGGGVGAGGRGFRAKLEHYMYSGEKKHVFAGIVLVSAVFAVPWYLMTRGVSSSNLGMAVLNSSNTSSMSQLTSLSFSNHTLTRSSFTRLFSASSSTGSMWRRIKVSSVNSSFPSSWSNSLETRASASAMIGAWSLKLEA